MSPIFRKVSFYIVVVGSLALMVTLVLEKAETPLDRSFAPVFTHLGKSTKILDNATGQILPISDEDEAALGNSEVSNILSMNGPEMQNTLEYLRKLLADLTANKQRKFDYNVRIFLGHPNASALPGGTLVITTKLLDMMETEAELAFVLAHEIAHQELRHVTKLIKFQMAAKKFGIGDLGRISDWLNKLVLQTSFSKTEEMEADDYALALMLSLGYEGNEAANILDKLESVSPASEPKVGNPFRDYVRSHPPMSMRVENIRAKTAAWKVSNPEATLRDGKDNFLEQMRNDGSLSADGEAKTPVDEASDSDPVYQYR